MIPYNLYGLSVAACTKHYANNRQNLNNPGRNDYMAARVVYLSDSVGKKGNTLGHVRPFVCLSVYFRCSF